MVSRREEERDTTLTDNRAEMIRGDGQAELRLAVLGMVSRWVIRLSGGLVGLIMNGFVR